MIVLRFRPHEEPGDAAELPQRVEAFAATGEHLVHVSLMAVSHTSLSRGDSKTDGAPP